MHWDISGLSVLGREKAQKLSTGDDALVCFPMLADFRVGDGDNPPLGQQKHQTETGPGAGL
jgi:hypothetical protein